MVATPIVRNYDSLSAAFNVGELEGVANYSDFVGSSDTNDYYRFTLNSASSFSLLLSGLNADADVQLLNSSGSVITSSTAGGAASERISRSLTAGMYYVRVYQFSGNTNYNLTLNATPSGPPDGAGDSLSTARNWAR